MLSRVGRASDKFCPGLRHGMGMGLGVMAFGRDLGQGGSCPGRRGRSLPHPGSTCGDFSVFLSPKLLGLLQHQTHMKASETALGRSWGTFVRFLNKSRFVAIAGQR